MNYGNMGIKRSVSIRQNDLTDLELFRKNKIFANLQKTKMQIFIELIVQSPGGYFRLSKIIIGLRYII